MVLQQQFSDDSSDQVIDNCSPIRNSFYINEQTSRYTRALKSQKSILESMPLNNNNLSQHVLLNYNERLNARLIQASYPSDNNNLDAHQQEQPQNVQFETVQSQHVLLNYNESLNASRDNNNLDAYQQEQPQNVQPVTVPFDSNKLLIDITLKDLARISTTFIPTMRYITDRFIAKTRKLWTVAIKKVIAHPTNELLWLKLILIPTVIFSDIDASARKTDQLKRIELLEKDDWSSFTIGMFTNRRQSKMSKNKGRKKSTYVTNITTSSPESLLNNTCFNNSLRFISDPKTDKDNEVNNRWHKVINDLGADGQIGKIMQLVDRDEMKLPVTDSVIQILKSKHPEAYETIDENFINVPANNVSLDMNISPENLRKLLNNPKKRNIKSGPSHTNYEHLRIMAGNGDDDAPDQNDFCIAYCKLISITVEGRASPSVYTFMRDSELIALPKLDKNNNVSDVRPIASGDLMRKLISAFILKSLCHVPSDNWLSLDNDNNIAYVPEIFKDSQYGLDRNGCEKIIHSARCYNGLHPNQDQFYMDGKNSFNTSNRNGAMRVLQQHSPQFLPFISRMYSEVSHGYVLMSNGSVNCIDSKEGWHQGDVLASLLYCLTKQPMINEMKDIIAEHHNIERNILRETENLHNEDSSNSDNLFYNLSAFLKFYIDDGNLIADFELMSKLIRYIITHGPRFGYYLNRKKGTYLLGYCSDNNIAYERKQLLIDEFDFDPNVICLHPDNGGDPLLYGAKVLGSFIGTDEYVATALQNKVTSLSKTCDNIITKIANYQLRQLVLKWCFCQKIVFLQRTSNPSLINKYLETDYTEMKFKILASILECPVEDIDNDLRKICSLHVSDGGVGIMNSYHISHVAYLSSIAECSESICVASSHETLESINSPSIHTAFSSLDFYNTFASNISSHKVVSFNDIIELGKTLVGYDLTLQHQLAEAFRQVHRQEIIVRVTDPSHRAWLESTATLNSGMFLEISPKTKMHTMSNEQLSTSMRCRIHMPLKQIVPRSVHSCGKACDVYGAHNLIGCGETERIWVHDMVTLQVQKTLDACDVITKSEPLHIFQAMDVNNKQRPDLYCFNLAGYGGQPVILDTMITCPYPPSGGRLTFAEATKPLRAANHGEHIKNNMHKYKNLAPAGGYGFKPLLIETSGTFGKSLEKILKDNIKRAADARKIPNSTLWRFWISALSIVFQRSAATAILQNIYNSRKKINDIEVTRQAILDFNFNDVANDSF